MQGMEILGGSGSEKGLRVEMEFMKKNKMKTNHIQGLQTSLKNGVTKKNI